MPIFAGWVFTNSIFKYFIYNLQVIVSEFESHWVIHNYSLPSRLGLEDTTTATLQRGKTPPNECPGYDTKQSDGEVPVKLKLWGMQSTLSLPSLPGPLWPDLLAPDRALSIVLTELHCFLMLKWIVWNRTILTFKLYTYAEGNCLK